VIGLDPLGDRAFLARFATEPEARNWAAAIRSRGPAGLIEVVLAYHAAAVFVDPDRVDFAELEAFLRGVVPEAGRPSESRLVELPVLYDGEDLPDVAARLGLPASEVVSAHSGRDYDVFAVGFQPGFPYAGYLPEALARLPRREAPRVRVPGGSVAIAGRQTGVYPAESPGGWHLLGRTPLRIVDLERAFFPIRAGDRLRFVPIGGREFDALRGKRLGETGGGVDNRGDR
jgi:KipI family sensor histidine kinase inhibitor